MVEFRFPTYKGLKRPLSNSERNFTLIYSDGEIFLLLPGLIGFRLDPFGIDGIFGPHDDRTFRSSQVPRSPH